MKALVFCSFEVGGWPYAMARTLNDEGVPCSYLSVAPGQNAHDSAAFHYERERAPWHLDGPGTATAPPSDDVLRSYLREAAAREGFTTCLATGDRAYLLREAGIPYLYWSYGSDLDRLCFGPIWPRGYRTLRKAWPWLRHALGGRRRSRRSVRDAAGVMIAPYQLEKLKRIAPGCRLFFLPHILPVRDVEELLAEKEAARQRVYGRIGPGPFLFSATRHVWTKHFREWADRKGNDVMFRAFARYRADTGDRETRLVLVAKGPDADSSRALAAELGVAGRTVWLEEMPRHLLGDLYRGATACFGQFGNPVITYSALEPLAQGTPCISYFGTVPTAVPFYTDLPPLFNSRDEEEIAARLRSLCAGGAPAREETRRAWQWTADNCSGERFAAAFLGA